MSDLDHHR
jgi:hypothetical protein